MYTEYLITAVKIEKSALSDMTSFFYAYTMLPLDSNIHLV